jgi:hypothetical protein
MTLTGVIDITNATTEEGGDFVAAFVGEECRGVTETVFENDLNKVYFYLTVFSNEFSGEEVNFKFYENSSEIIADATNVESFEDGKNLGTASDPYRLTDKEITATNLTGVTEFSVYPNPSSGMISLQTVKPGDKIITITNLSGKTVKEIHTVERDIQLNVNAINPGIYMMNVYMDGTRNSKKLIIQ